MPLRAGTGNAHDAVDDLFAARRRPSTTRGSTTSTATSGSRPRGPSTRRCGSTRSWRWPGWAFRASTRGSTIPKRRARPPGAPRRWRKRRARASSAASPCAQAARGHGRPGRTRRGTPHTRRRIDEALAADIDDVELWLLRGNAEEATAAGRGQRGGAASTAFYLRGAALAPDNGGRAPLPDPLLRDDRPDRRRARARRGLRAAGAGRSRTRTTCGATTCAGWAASTRPSPRSAGPTSWRRPTTRRSASRPRWTGTTCTTSTCSPPPTSTRARCAGPRPLLREAARMPPVTEYQSSTRSCWLSSCSAGSDGGSARRHPAAHRRQWAATRVVGHAFAGHAWLGIREISRGTR